MWTYFVDIFTFSYTASILGLKVGDSYISPASHNPEIQYEYSAMQKKHKIYNDNKLNTNKGDCIKTWW